MKNTGILFSVMMIALMIFNKPLSAQSYQYELNATATNGVFPCGVIVNGYFTYHVTYHLNKEGEITNLHCNVTHQDLWNVETKERVRVLDVTNDNAGILWLLYSSLNAFNEGFNIVYEQDDGWIDTFLPLDFPTTGKTVNINFKVVGKGGVIGYWKTHVLIRLDSNGELVWDFLQWQDDFICR